MIEYNDYHYLLYQHQNNIIVYNYKTINTVSIKIAVYASSIF